jgi:antitoxin component YwqK of YwqJK toxin-antitoxin module
MKNEILSLSIFVLTLQVYGQTSIKIKEIKIPYTNGYEVFNICSSGCSTTFDDNKEYYWYTEFSKVKSTKGGSGGNLLHGNYKFYDENGNLRMDKNYYLGLSEGSEKNWDSLGNITSQYRYSKGDMIYMKFKNDENYWIEFNGPMFTEGTVRKVYTQYNSLVSEETMLANFKQKIKTFYEYSGKLKEEFTTSGLGRDYLTGKYVSYYENGKIEVEGQFYDGEYLNLRTGVWKWYNSDGTSDGTENYKAEVVKWPNGELKMAGGYILNTETNEWLKDGQWRWYDEEGKLKTSIKYKWGAQTND